MISTLDPRCPCDHPTNIASLAYALRPLPSSTTLRASTKSCLGMWEILADSFRTADATTTMARLAQSNSPIIAIEPCLTGPILDLLPVRGRTCYAQFKMDEIPSYCCSPSPASQGAHVSSPTHIRLSNPPPSMSKKSRTNQPSKIS